MADRVSDKEPTIEPRALLAIEASWDSSSTLKDTTGGTSNL